MKKKFMYGIAAMLLLAAVVLAAQQISGSYTLTLDDEVVDYLSERAPTQQIQDALVSKIAQEEITERYQRQIRNDFYAAIEKIEQFVEEGNYTAMENAVTALERI